MQDSHGAAGKADQFTSTEPPAYRLVIRARIIPDSPPPPPVSQTVARRSVAIVLGVAALLIFIWIGVSVFGNDPSERVVTERSTTVASPTAPPATTLAVSNAVPPLTRSTVDTRSADAASAQPRSTEPTAPPSRVKPPPNALPSPINEVIPDVPQSALRTIRGTVRVAIRVTIGNDGAVLEATSHHPGPSRYFERLSRDAARSWTFTPSNAPEQRSMLIRFYYTREGATAEATALE